MSGISSGVGLISGINTAQLIEQLMAIEARPVQALQTRVRTIDTQKAAVLGVSARILALQNAVAQFHRQSFFQRFGATSSNEQVVTAAARPTAIPGSQTFRVLSLATNHAVLSRGFADADRTPIGTGTLSIEVGRGRVDPATPLGGLNSGNGVRRGVIRITDRSGASADIDLSRAYTVEDVLQAINGATGIRVRASVTGITVGNATGDRVVIEDLSGGLGDFTIADRNGGFTALDLGIVQSVALSRIDGKDLVQLTSATQLSALNDGNGVGRVTQGSNEDDLVFETTYGTFGVTLKDILAPGTNTNSTVDLRALNGGNGVRLGVIRITDRAGKSVDIDLAGAPTPLRTVQDVRQYITDQAAAAGVSISIAPVNSYLQIADTTGLTATGAKNLKVEDISGSAAADLGIAADVAAESIRGADIFSVRTLGDVVNAINYAQGNAGFVEARISDDGKGIAITAQGLDNAVTVRGGIGSTAAQDLGLEKATVATGGTFQSRRLIAGLNTVLLHSLKGGAGITGGVVTFTNRANQTASIDLSAAATLQDVVDLVNADAGTGIRAAINPTHNGLQFSDTSSGIQPVVIADSIGTLAADLGIAGSFDTTATSIAGKNLQRQYVTRQTLLSELTGGQEIGAGRFRITSSTGSVHNVNVTSNITTVGGIIDAVNLVGGGLVAARINDTGDGILVSDQAGGSQKLKIEDVDGGTIAKSVRLRGEALAGATSIDGSFELKIELGGRDTLRDLARKLNDAGLPISASVLQSGVGANPFSLSITSTQSGRGGELLIDAPALSLGFQTLSTAEDALLSIGGGDAGSGLLIVNGSNTFDNVLEGVRLDVLAADDAPVTVTVTQDVDAIVESIKTFVDAYNDVQSELDDSASFNTDTLERGPLFGDSTVSVIRQRLSRLSLQRYAGEAGVSRLFNIGIRAGANNRLEFDETKFREAYEASPESVEQFFTAAETGFGAVIQKAFDDLTRDFDGVIARREQVLTDQQELLNERIDRLNVLLGAKRTRLERQFSGLESSLAALQDQQNSLSALTRLAATGRA